VLFRFNNRATKDKPVDERDRFMLAASRIPGKSLTQAELASKAGETKPEEPDRVRRSFTTESSRSPGSAPLAFRSSHPRHSRLATSNNLPPHVTGESGEDIYLGWKREGDD
jgi:hypothetical protein